ncbi:F-box only protein 24-like [Aquila chrysaetos chrysaetos]|uniref:F-box only protein 24-like n=1 Tax=Aquila chrysaetos chrysaetos TaxID=223781 RepID=UPI0011771D52|nr:F-box only protein 24-like [Aquila chrysaetos chrysaetos]
MVRSWRMWLPCSFPPPDMLLHVISFLTLPNLLRLGQTCCYLHKVCNSEAIWCHLCIPLHPAIVSAWPCKRATILNCESLPLPREGVVALCCPADDNVPVSSAPDTKGL